MTAIPGREPDVVKRLAHHGEYRTVGLALEADITDAIAEIVLLRRLVGIADAMLAAGYSSLSELDVVNDSPSLMGALHRAKNGSTSTDGAA